MRPIRTATLAVVSAALGWCAPALADVQHGQVAIQCTDQLQITQADAYTLTCTGDLTLQGLEGTGRIAVDTPMAIRADGVLSLRDVLVQAPRITLSGEAGLIVDAGSILRSAELSFSGGAGNVAMAGRLDTVEASAVSGSGSGGGLSLAAGSDVSNGSGSTGGGRGTVPSQGGDLIVGDGTLGSNDPKFGNVRQPTLGSAVPEAGTAWTTLLGLAGICAAVGRTARGRRTGRPAPRRHVETA